MNNKSFAKKYILNINDSNSSLERDENSVFKNTGLPKIKTPGADLWDSIDHTRDRTEDSLEGDGYHMQPNKIIRVQNSATEANINNQHLHLPTVGGSTPNMFDDMYQRVGSQVHTARANRRHFESYASNHKRHMMEKDPGF